MSVFDSGGEKSFPKWTWTEIFVTKSLAIIYFNQYLGLCLWKYGKAHLFFICVFDVLKSGCWNFI